MPRRRISMNKIREMLRLNESKLSNRQVARALNISRPVVGEYLAKFEKSGLSYTAIKEMSDAELMKVFETKWKEKSYKYRILSEKFEYFAKELKKTGVRLAGLWKEYKEENPDGYDYSRFCYHYQVWRNASQLTMHIDHKAGEKMFVDFTGKKMEIYDVKTKQFLEVEIFVAILPASQLTYVEATESQKKENWIKANENALWYFGGVTRAITPDNLKSGVTNSDKYEPDINPVYADFARHYDTVILPTRPGKSRDKAYVENAVKIVYMRIFAALRNQIFYSLEELNVAIIQQLEIHNNTYFQRMKISRRELFNEIEKHVLKSLPLQKYEWKNFLSKKVQFNYHIEITEDKHYYSVPWQYRGKQVRIIYTTDVVEIYNSNNERIAFHKRDKRINGYTTLSEHRHPNHEFYAEWSPEKLINWSNKIGNDVKAMIEKVLESWQYPEQAFKSCLGILSLAKKYGNDRLNLACSRALRFNYYSGKAVKNILEKGLDKIQEEVITTEPLPEHKNIRGENYYN
jgi:transposase